MSRAARFESVINGIGAVGTTINYVPKTPVFGESSFEGLAASGSFDMRRLALGGGAQLSDNLALRLDGAHQQNAQQSGLLRPSM